MVIQLLAMSTQVQDAATSPTFPLPPPPPPPTSMPPQQRHHSLPPMTLPLPLPLTSTFQDSLTGRRQVGRRGAQQPKYCCVTSCSRTRSNSASQCPKTVLAQGPIGSGGGVGVGGGIGIDVGMRGSKTPPANPQYGNCCPYYYNNYNSCGYNGNPCTPAPGAPELRLTSPATAAPILTTNFNNAINSHPNSYQLATSAITNPLSHYMLENNSSHGCFRRSVPSMPVVMAVLLCILNCFLPGTGTLLASVTILFGASTEYGKDKWKRAFIICFIAAVLQMATAIFVIGWVWSIMWGINFCKHSTNGDDKYSFTNNNNNDDF